MERRPEHKRPKDKDARKKMVYLMNQLSPGTEWCSRFLASYDQNAVSGVTDAEVNQVKSWSNRIEQLKDGISRDPLVESVPLTDSDKLLQRNVKLLQSKFGRQALSKATQQTPARPEEPKKDKAVPLAKPSLEIARQAKNDHHESSDRGRSSADIVDRPGSQPPSAAPLQKSNPVSDHPSTQAKSESLDDVDSLAEYSSAGVIAFAVRDRIGPAGYSFPDNAKSEAVVLMVAEKKNHTVLALPTARPSGADGKESASTALRALHEATLHIFEFDSSNIARRLSHDMPKTHLLSRCFQQSCRFALHFTQIPYLPNANELFAKATTADASPRVEALCWVPLHEFCQAGKVKKAAIQLNPGDPSSKWRRIPFYGFLQEILLNKKISDKLVRLEKLVKSSEIQALPQPAHHATFDLLQESQSDNDKPKVSMDISSGENPGGKHSKRRDEKAKKRKRDQDSPNDSRGVSESSSKKDRKSKKAKLE